MQSHCAAGHRFILKTRTRILKIRCGNKQDLLVSLIIIGIVLRVINKKTLISMQHNVNEYIAIFRTKIQLKYFRNIAYNHAYGVFNMASVSLL